MDCIWHLKSISWIISKGSCAVTIILPFRCICKKAELKLPRQGSPILFIDFFVYNRLHLAPNIFQSAVAVRCAHRKCTSVMKHELIIIHPAVNPATQVRNNCICRIIDICIRDDTAIFIAFYLIKIRLRFIMITLSERRIYLPRLHIIFHNIWTIFNSFCFHRIRCPGAMTAYIFNLSILQVDILISQISKSIGIASNRIFPCNIHMVPVAVQFNQVPCMCFVINIPGLQTAQLRRLQKCVRIAGTLSLSKNDCAVCC